MALIPTQVGTQRRCVLEAVAFGTFLRDVETWVDTVRGFSGLLVWWWWWHCSLHAPSGQGARWRWHVASCLARPLPPPTVCPCQHPFHCLPLCLHAQEYALLTPLPPPKLPPGSGGLPDALA